MKNFIMKHSQKYTLDTIVEYRLILKWIIGGVRGWLGMKFPNLKEQ
jgi:hypothetical protein